jgi:hypothetical protein
MVSMRASNSVDRGFEHRPGQSEDYEIGMCCFSVKLNTQHSGVRTKTGLLGIRIIYPSGTTCLPAECCFSELAL